MVFYKKLLQNSLKCETIIVLEETLFNKKGGIES